MEPNNTAIQEWKGKVSVKNFIFVQQRFCEINNSGIIIHKNTNPESETFLNIPKNVIDSTKPPIPDIFDTLINGYNGFAVRYTDVQQNKIKTLNLWPSGFLAQIDNKSMPIFSQVLSQLNPEGVDKSSTIVPDNKSQMIVGTISFVIVILGWFLFGAVGLIILGIGGVISSKILKNENMDQTLRYLLVTLVMGAALFLSLLFSLIIGLLLNKVK
ncbi:hypothetical protein JW887_03750 [Candidatus Dojkabacteria bacterium]|nr:hypothetical protein [Candidatus Dojkabacteria bacterium]